MGVPCCICEVIASSCQARDPFVETAFLVDQPKFKKHFILLLSVFTYSNSYISYLWLTSMTAMAGAQRHGTPRISWGFSMPVKFVVTNPNYGEGPPQP